MDFNNYSWLLNEIVNHTCTFDKHTSFQYWLVKKQPLAIGNLFEVEAIDYHKSEMLPKVIKCSAGKRQTMSMINT